MSYGCCGHAIARKNVVMRVKPVMDMHLRGMEAAGNFKGGQVTQDRDIDVQHSSSVNQCDQRSGGLTRGVQNYCSLRKTE